MEFSGKNTVVGNHSLQKRIFLIQGSKPGLLSCRWFTGWATSISISHAILGISLCLKTSYYLKIKLTGILHFNPILVVNDVIMFPYQVLIAILTWTSHLSLPLFSSVTLATWCDELTPWKRPWCWERLKAGGEGDDRGRDVWMASLTWWTCVWASSGSWWWTGKPGVLQSMGWRKARHDWATELNWAVWPRKPSNSSSLHFLICEVEIWECLLHRMVTQQVPGRPQTQPVWWELLPAVASFSSHDLNGCRTFTSLTS